MSGTQEDPNEDRPTVVGTDPDMNIGDEDPAEQERAERAEDEAEPTAEDPVEVEDLP